MSLPQVAPSTQQPLSTSISLCVQNEVSVTLDICLFVCLFGWLVFCFLLFFFFFFFFWRSPAISLGFTTFGRDFCASDRFFFFF